MNLEAQRQLIRSGAVYNDLTAELVKAREDAVTAATDYNASFGRPAAQREALLANVLGTIGTGVHFEPTFRCEFGHNISIGNDFYANFDCILLDGGDITIGDNVLFGPRVSIYTTNHALDPRERAAGACYVKPVRVGNNVWVGGGVTINQGVTIGDNAVIGSGSVITRDIPANTVAAGVPATVLRHITDDDRTGFTG
ncbi:MAG TPA: sugar O-acetyltransferase [Arthrobacter sp.]|nr:sugar O-acetyltransferase [Arthrobacter sp.]